MKRSLLAAAGLAATLLLSGCTAMQERITAHDNNYCQGMGLKFGTPEFAQCRLTLDAQRDQQLSEGLDMMAKGASNRRQPTTIIIER